MNTLRTYLSVAAVSVAIAAAVPLAASAQPSGKGGNYFARPPAAAKADPSRPAKAANCDCPMMKGDATQQARCMMPMDRQPDLPSEPPPSR
jgi:hypothetical protein